MSARPDQVDFLEPRLLVAADVQRLAPLVEDYFAPIPVSIAPDYLAAVAELPRAATQGVVLGIDTQCRRFEEAVGTIKQAAGESRVVICCEPAFEPLSRRLLAAGADDYVIYPPTADDMQRALQIASRRTRERWMRPAPISTTPSFEELHRLTEILPQITSGSRVVLRDMAAAVASALRAESAMIVVDGSTAAVGPDQRTLIESAVLIQDILRDGRPVGQIRLGPSLVGAFDQDDAAKLRLYGTLWGNLLELAARTNRWQQLAHIDDLTGLPNRRRLMGFLDEVLHRAQRDESPVTVLLYDIDDFKTFNDQYGHEVGDEIIRECGRLFTRCCRKQDLVARYGGDEFVVVFADSGGPRTAGSQQPSEVIDVLQRFRKALAEHTFERIGPRSSAALTCSGGLARFPWQGRTGNELIERADEALLEAKRAGKNRFWLVGSGAVCPAES